MDGNIRTVRTATPIYTVVTLALALIVINVAAVNAYARVGPPTSPLSETATVGVGRIPVPHGGFEDGAGWTFNPDAYSTGFYDSTAIEGVQSYRAQNTDRTHDAHPSLDSTEYIEISANEVYSISVWAKASVVGGMRVTPSFAYYDSSHTLIATGFSWTSTTLSTTAWTFVVATPHIAPSNAAYIKVSLGFGLAATRSINVDDVRLVQQIHGGTLMGNSVTSTQTAGRSGTFTTVDSKTVTVTNGLITSII